MHNRNHRASSSVSERHSGNHQAKLLTVGTVGPDSSAGAQQESSGQVSQQVAQWELLGWAPQHVTQSAVTLSHHLQQVHQQGLLDCKPQVFADISQRQLTGGPRSSQVRPRNQECCEGGKKGACHRAVRLQGALMASSAAPNLSPSSPSLAKGRQNP